LARSTRAPCSPHPVPRAPVPRAPVPRAPVPRALLPGVRPRRVPRAAASARSPAARSSPLPPPPPRGIYRIFQDMRTRSELLRTLTPQTGPCWLIPGVCPDRWPPR